MAEGGATAGIRSRVVTHARTPLARGGFLLSVANAASGGLGFLFWIVAARTTDTLTVGLATSVVAALNLVAGVAQLNLTSVLVRYVGGLGATRRRFVARAYVVATVLPLGAAVGLVLALDGRSGTLADALARTDVRIVFIIGTVVWSLFTLQDAALTALRRPGLVAVENVGYAVAKVLLLPLVATASGLLGVLLVWVLPSAALTIAISSALFLRLLRSDDSRLRIAEPGTREVVSFVAGNAVASLSVVLTLNAIPLIVASRAGAEDAAHFYMPWVIATSVVLLVMGASSVATVEAVASPTRIPHLLRASITQALVVAVPAAAVLLVAGPTLLSAFGRSYAAGGGSVARALALGIIPAAVLAASLAVVRALNRSRLIALTQIVAALTALTGALVTVPIYGPVGAALSWSIGQILGCAVLGVAAKRRL